MSAAKSASGGATGMAPPGFHGACHRARIRATRWFNPGYKSCETLRRDMSRGRQSRQRVGEFVAVERLYQEAVHTGFEAGIAIFHQRVGGERQDRRRPAGLTGLERADALGGFDAVEL